LNEIFHASSPLSKKELVFEINYVAARKLGYENSSEVVGWDQKNNCYVTMSNDYKDKIVVDEIESQPSFVKPYKVK